MLKIPKDFGKRNLFFFQKAIFWVKVQIRKLKGEHQVRLHLNLPSEKFNKAFLKLKDRNKPSGKNPSKALTKRSKKKNLIFLKSINFKTGILQIVNFTRKQINNLKPEIKIRYERQKINLGILGEDWEKFIFFIVNYSRKHLKEAAFNFEQSKDSLISFLIERRGARTRPFMHMSLMMLVFAGIISAPIIAESYPTVTVDETLSEFLPPSAVLSSFNQEEFEISTLISDKPRDQIIVYKVAEGDTLSTIAQKFGVSTDTIRWENDLKSDRLKPDQELRILPATGIKHKVKSGDTIYSIAKKYKTEAQNIVNFPFNDFSDLDTFALNVGQILIVPDGVMPQAPAVSRPMSTTVMIAGGSGQLAWPTSGQITQRPVWYHMALDIANKTFPAVTAAAAGTVSSVQYLRYGYGQHVIIDHGNGLQTLYAHLSAINVKVGQSVGVGESIGQMGSTGRSSGIHLHFEVRKNGQLVNPLGYLK